MVPVKIRYPLDREFKGVRAHLAERRRIRRDLRSRDRHRRDRAKIEQHLWTYKDARLRGDDAAAEAAWQAHHQVWRQLGRDGHWLDNWYVPSQIIRLAAGLDDIDRAARELLEWHRHVDTRNADSDNQRRTAARTFVSACIHFLGREASIGHPQEAEIDAVMRDVAARIEDELNPSHWDGFWRIGELRGWRHVARASGQLAAALRPPDAVDRPALPDALADGDTPAGGGQTDQRQQVWRRVVAEAGSVAERARLAAAWVAWAVGTREPDLAAEAYQEVMRLVPSVVSARPEESARQRVLAAVQEHTEEAGYWLARTGRYREAVVALETGRAVGLSLALSLTGTAAEQSPSDVTYDDVLAATGEGALIYLAAATAGGYALVVAARHDPQFVELPKLDRATVAGLLGSLLPGAGAGHAPVTSSALRQAPAAERDAEVLAQRSGDLLVAGLETLWEDGLRLLGFSAGGRVVTYLPVGMMTLLPLHAVSAPGRTGIDVEWRHFGSAVRFAPNARGLVRCQDTARELAAAAARSRALLAVDVPEGFGVGVHGHLRYVERETAEVVRRWAGSASARHGCAWEEFRSAADEHTVWHLACHGSANPRAILDSRLYFADRAVTLRELREALPAGRRRLAVLSACESNLADASLPNEVVGLPSALLQVGFAGVMASSWKVDDLATAYLMAAFYQSWCGEGQEPAVALHLAQRWLRTATRTDLTAMLPGVEPGGGDGECPYRHPRYWAAFAYTGA
jgi:hypothetical protein